MSDGQCGAVKQSQGLFCIVMDVLLRRVSVSYEKRQNFITVPFLVLLKYSVTVLKYYFYICALYSSITEAEYLYSCAKTFSPDKKHTYYSLYFSFCIFKALVTNLKQHEVVLFPSFLLSMILSLAGVTDSYRRTRLICLHVKVKYLL